MVGPRTLKIWTTNSGLQMIVKASREPDKLIFRELYQTWLLHAKVEIMRLCFELVGSFTPGIWSTEGFGKSMHPRTWTLPSKLWSQRGTGDWNWRKFASGEYAFTQVGIRSQHLLFCHPSDNPAIIPHSLPSFEYSATDLEPDQDIRTWILPDWNSSLPKASRSLLQERSNTGVFLTDILDLFLSSLGPAPKNATKEIILSPFGVYVWVPMYSCCFLSSGERDSFLGSSLKGYSLDRQFTGCWKTMLTIASQHLMVPINQLELLCVPKSLPDPGEGSHFGNCAETLPFIYLLMWVP